MNAPVLIVNCKAYAEATAARAVALAKVCEKVGRSSGVLVCIAVQAADIGAVSSAVSIPVFAQHVDAVRPGQFTGHTLPEAVVANGASGTLINHSERRVPLDVVDATVRRCRDAGLFSVVCARDATEAGRVATLHPDLVAYEPPELVGGDVSVSTAKPQVIQRAVKKIGTNSACIVGAGVKTAEDVRKSIELGAHGVLVASGVVLAKDQGKALRALLSGFES